MHRWTATGPVWAGPAAVSAALTLPFLGRASLWADEVDSVSAALRTWPQTGHLLRQQDAPLAAYYGFLHVWVAAGGAATWWLRLPSAMAIVTAVVVTSVLGARLFGRVTGILAGLILAANPFVGGYGLDARPYAFTVALAVLAALLLLGQEAPTAHRRALYAAVMAVGVFAHLFFVLLLPAHAAGLAIQRRTLRPWVLPWLAIVVLTGPVLLLSAGQSNEVSYLTAPTVLRWAAWVPTLAGGPAWVAGPIVALGLLGARWRRWEGAPVGPLLAWALVPGALLLAVSSLHPLYLSRYVIESAPALALLAARGAQAVWATAQTARVRELRLVGLGAVLGLAVATCAVTLDAPYRYEDPQAAADYVLDGAHRGEGVVYLPVSARTAVEWYLRAEDPGSPRPHDLLLDPRHNEQLQGNFGGRDVSPALGRSRVLNREVVWVVAYANGSGRDRPAARAALDALRRCFAASQPSSHFGLLTVSRFRRLPRSARGTSDCQPRN